MKTTLLVLALAIQQFAGLNETTEVSTSDVEKKKAMIMNPGFEEEGEKAFRDDWLNKSFGGSLQISNGPVFEGVKSGKLPKEGDRIAYQLISVEPKTTYTISFYYLLRNDADGDLTVTILNGDVSSKSNVESGTIETSTFTNEVYSKRYEQGSITFNSGDNSKVGLFLTNTGVDARFDSFSIKEAEDQ